MLITLATREGNCPSLPDTHRKEILKLKRGGNLLNGLSHPHFCPPAKNAQAARMIASPGHTCSLPDTVAFFLAVKAAKSAQVDLEMQQSVAFVLAVVALFMHVVQTANELLCP